MGHNGIRFPNEDGLYKASHDDSTGIQVFYDFEEASTPSVNAITIAGTPQYDMTWGAGNSRTSSFDGFAIDNTGTTHLSAAPSSAQNHLVNSHFSKNATCEAWVNLPGYFSAFFAPFGQYGKFFTPDGNSYFIFYIIGNGAGVSDSTTCGLAMAHFNGTTFHSDQTADNLFPINTDTHIAWTTSSTGAEIRINDSHVDTLTFTDLATTPTSDIDCMMGGPSTEYLRGSADKLAFWVGVQITDFSDAAAAGIQPYFMHHINHNCNVHKDGELIEPNIREIYDINNHRRI